MAETWFRNADARYPFLQVDAGHPPGRWHAAGDGPVQCLADTPDGAWAEFLRHEGITEAIDLAGVSRDLWAIEVGLDDEVVGSPDLAVEVLRGGEGTYPACQREAARLRASGKTGLVAPAAALNNDTAGGQGCAEGSLRERAGDRDGRTLVLFGPRPHLVGWRCCQGGHPDARVLNLVRQA